MSSTVGSRSGAGSKKYVDFDEMVAIQLEKARSGIRANDLLMGAVGLGVFLAAYLFVFLVLDHWVFAQGVGTGLRIALWLGIVSATVGWIGWKVAVPYLRRVTSLFAAKEIELTRPELKSNLLTLVDLRQAGRPVSPQILQAIEKRAAVSLADLDVDHAIDRRSLMHWSYVLLGIVALLCVYTLLTPKRLGPSLLRAFVPIADVAVGTQTRIEKVTPGDTTILSRSQVTIETQLLGKIPETVRVLYSTEDRRFVDEPLVLNDTGEGLNRFRGTLTGERGKGLLQSLTYRVEAGDAISPTFTITVTQPPSATVQDVAYDYPAYMGLEDRTQANPTIDAWEGTKVTLRAVSNRPVTVARILFSDSEETAVKAEELTMKITDGVNLSATWPLAFRSDGTYPHFYRIHVETADGSRDPQPTLFPLKIRADLAPKVEIFHPLSDVTAPANGSVQVAWQAGDPDFLLKDVMLRYEKRGQELPEVDALFESPPQRPSAKGMTTIDLKRFDVRTGDKLTFWIEARDNLEPFGERRANVSKTPRINITIVDPVDQKQVDQKAQQEKQEAQDKLDQAPPPPQEERPNPQPDEQPQPEKNPEQQPKPNDDRKPGERDQKPDPMMGEEGKPKEGDQSAQGGEGTQGEASKDGMGPMQPQPNGAGKSRPDGKSGPMQGTPQEQRQDDKTNPDGTPKDSGTGGGSKKNPQQTGQPQNPKPQQGGGSETGSTESQPQSDGTPEGQESKTGAGSKTGGSGAKPSGTKDQNRDNRASDEEALNKLLDKFNNDARKQPEAGKDEPKENSDSSTGSRSPMDRTKPDGSGSNSGNDAEKTKPPGSSGRTGTEPMEANPMKTGPLTGSDPKEPGASPESTDPTNTNPRDPKSPTGKPMGDGESKKPEAGKPGSEKTGPDQTAAGKPEEEKTGPGKTGTTPKGTDPKGTGPRPDQTGKTDPGMKKEPGNPDGGPGQTGQEKNPQGTDPGTKGASPEKSTDPKGTGKKPDGGPMPAGTGADSTNSTDKPETTGGGGNEPPMPGTMPEPGTAPMPSAGGTGEKPMPGKAPEKDPGKGAEGAGARQQPDPSGTGAKPKPGEGPGGEKAKDDPGAGAPMKEPGDSNTGNDTTKPGTKPRPGEKTTEGTGKAGGDKTGDTKPVKRNPTPMGATEEPSANSNDPKTQQSPDPMKGKSGQSAPASEGNAGAKERGPGDTTSRPGEEGSGKPQTGAGKKPGGPKGAGEGTAGEDPMMGPSGTKPGGMQNGMGGEGTEDDSAPAGAGKPKTGPGGEKEKTTAGSGAGEKSQPGAKDPQKGAGAGGAGKKPEDPRRPEGSDPMSGGEGSGEKKGPKPGETGKKNGDAGSKPGTQQKPGGGEQGMPPGGMKPGGEQGGGEQQNGGEGGMPPGGMQPGGGMGESGGDMGPSSGAPSTPMGNQPGPGGGPGGAPPPEGKPDEAAQPGRGDEATDLANRKKSVNLMLKRLQDELRRGETDPQLLKDLGFTESELQQFLKRVDQQLNSADDETPEGLARRRQFEEMLKGLGSRSQGETRDGGTGPRQASGGFGGRSSTAPAEYAREAEAYKKRLSQKKAGAK